MICKSENDIPLGMWWNRILTEGEATGPAGRQPRRVGDLEMHWLPLACQHCDDAPCVKVCPSPGDLPPTTTASVMQDVGPVHRLPLLHDRLPVRGAELQLGGARVRPDARHETGMVEARPLGTVEKCTMCVQRLAEGQVPSCVWSCPAQARIFGDLNDPDGRLVHADPRTGSGDVLLEEAGTDPTVYYLTPRRRSPL